MGGRQWGLEAPHPRRLGVAGEADAGRIPRQESWLATAVRTGARACASDRRRQVRARPPRVQQGRRSPCQRGDGRSGSGMTSRLASALMLVTVLVPAARSGAEDVEPVTVRASRLTQPLVVDGRLDDAVYHTIEHAPGFLQQEPRVREP